MRWPWMTRKEHEKIVAEWRASFDVSLNDQRKKYQAVCDAEYQRAVREGRAALHKIAVDMTYEIFLHGTNATTPSKWRAFLQDLEKMFIPSKTQLEEK
jgi:hypothetical protein